MQYTRPMIDLVYEIRRRVDADMKPSVKLANPEVLSELAGYYLRTKDTVTKTLIKELLSLAGDVWESLIHEPSEPVPSVRQVVKVYRGQTMLEDAVQTAVTEAPPKPVRMYRGAPVLTP